MTKKKKLTLCSLLLSLAVSTGVALGVATYAGFSAKALVNPPIASKGSINNIKTIYFNANLWDVDEPVIYMKRFDSESSLVSNSMLWVPVTKEIRPNIGGVEFHFYVFQYDTNVSYSKFKFVRLNPKGTAYAAEKPTLPSSLTADFEVGEWNKAVAKTDDNRVIWNYSKNITYNSNYDYYVIEKWDQSANDSCMMNTLTYNIEGEHWDWSGNADIPAVE